MSEAALSDHAWWDAPDDNVHDRVIGVVRYIRQNQADRKLEGLLFEALYGGQSVSGFGLTAARRIPLLSSSRLSLNVCRNMVGAVVSKVAAKNKPKPMFLTEDGDYELREKAKMLEQFVGGVFYESGVYHELAACFRDAAVYGTGVLKIFPGDDRVEVQRRHPLSVIVDDLEGAEGDPANIYERKYVDRLELQEKWADNPAAVAALATRRTPDQDDLEYGYMSTADQVLVTESWHRGYGGKAGRHCICIEGCTLLDEEWTGGFPFAFMRWSKPLHGFFGVGLVYELMGIQREINKLLQQIQRGHHMIGGHWLVENGAKVNTAQLNNDLASIVRYSGSKPEYQVPSIISPEIYAHLWQLYAKAFEISGISQLNATGQKPAGLDSGEAQRVYQDIQTERFLEVGQDYEEFVIEAARQVVQCAKRVGGSYSVRAPGNGAAPKLKWADVHLPDDLYVIKVYPTSLLPSTPAGKIAWAQDMIKSGLMSSDDAFEVLDHPDTDAYKRRKLAPRKIIERNIAHMLKTGEFVSPEPFDNHKLALQLVNEAYAEARLDKVPEDRLELLRRYSTDSADLDAQANPPAPPPMPMGAPMPPPGAPPMPMPPAAPPMAA